MPLIVDKDKEKAKILAAFESCLLEKPMLKVTLRDIAQKAHMTHPKLLNYFDNKDALILEYCNYTKNYMCSHCKTWFETHAPNSYEDKKAYMNAFLEYVAGKNSNESRPVATVQTYVLAKYDNNIKLLIKEEFASWKNLMKECLTSVYGDSITDSDAEYMMVLISGIFICNYNNVLSDDFGANILNCAELLIR